MTPLDNPQLDDTRNSSSSITETQEAEFAIHGLQDLLEKVPGGIAVVHGPSHVHTFANPVYQGLFGGPSKSLLGKTIREVFSEVEGPGIYELFDRVFVSGTAHIANEVPAVFDRSGSGIAERGYYIFVAQPVRDKHGTVTDILIYAYEVTEQVVAQQKLQESEERFHTIVNQTTVGIAQADLSGKYLLVNKRYCEMVGCDEAELLQKSMADITCRDDLPRYIELFERMLLEETDFVLEMRYIHKSGAEVWVNNSVSLIRDAAGKPQYVLAICPEITEAKEAQRLIAERQRQAAVVEERQRLANELHDSVSQALFSTTMIAESLPLLWERNPEQAKARTQQVVTLTRGALAEMRSLLLELRPEAIIRSKLHDLLKQLGEVAQGRRQLELILELEASEEVLPAEVQVALYRIAQESINNVIKHSQATQLLIALQYEPEQLTLRIEDNGKGFDQQATSGGMGQTTLRERANAIGASLTIDSAVGQGTRILLVWQSSVSPSSASLV